MSGESGLPFTVVMSGESKLPFTVDDRAFTLPLIVGVVLIPSIEGLSKTTGLSLQRKGSVGLKT